MNELLIFWSLVLLVAFLGATLRDVLGDDPRRTPDYRPPASHHLDEFSRRGSDGAGS